MTVPANYGAELKVLCQCAIITNEIQSFGLARVEDGSKMQKRFIEFVIIPS